MKKNTLNVLMVSTLGGALYGCSTTPYNPYDMPPNVWEKKVETDHVQFERKFIPLQRNRKIVAIDRFELRLVNQTNYQRCATADIVDRRNTGYGPHFKRELELLGPYETKYIGSYTPKQNDEGDFDVQYNIKPAYVTQRSDGTYRCSNSAPDDGLCYITTAMCRDTGKADDCEELQTLRKYRDEVMLNNEVGRELVKEYYLKAPKIVAKIDQDPNHKEVYQQLREQYIEPAAHAARSGHNDEALHLYKSMVETLAKTYL